MCPIPTTPAPIYLASTSPRRAALLGQLGIPFEVLVSEVREERQPRESPAAYVARVARDKAVAACRKMQQDALPVRPLVAADTCVVVGQDILGKPRDREDGMMMLVRLAGTTHEVLTAIHLTHAGHNHAVLSRSRVTMREVSTQEIKRYWDCGEPCDKAGAYAIQGRAAAFVSHIQGSYSGIVGLPLYELVQLLRLIGYYPL